MLIGCDFSSRPTTRKPIVLALGGLDAGVVTLDGLSELPTFAEFSGALQHHSDWVGGFDFPFGLPRELVLQMGWSTRWRDCMRTYAALSRPEIRNMFAAFCAAREPGRKFAHRATDRWAGSSPSMKWVNPPVAYMLHAGVPLLIEAGVHIPGLDAGDHNDVDAAGQPRRVALEAYPGLLAREVLGRDSYKSDDKKRQNLQRQARRAFLIDTLALGQTRLALRLTLTPAQRGELIADGSGDRLDAVLCLMQAAWGVQHGGPEYGLPATIDPLEGWIVSAVAAAQPCG